MQRKQKSVRILTAAAIILAVLSASCILLGINLMRRQTPPSYSGARYVWICRGGITGERV